MVTMTKKEWLKIHQDFRNDDVKNPRTLKYIEGLGTCSVPVKFIK